MTERWGYIARGRVGWHAEADTGHGCCSSSRGSLEEYVAEAEDGAYVVDAEEIADSPAFYREVVSGPMVSCRVSSWEPIGADVLEAGANMMGPGGLEGAFASVLTMGLAHRSGPSTGPGPLDYVSPAEMAARMRAIGAKVGRVRSGAVVWEHEA